MAMDPKELNHVCELVLKRSGIVLDPSKEYLVEARLTMLAKKLGVASISALIAQIKIRGANETAERSIVDAMTTNETSFFRDATPFETLKKIVLPAIKAKRATDKKLSIWCAASSTGQEPYTVAMLLREHLPELANWQLTFIASDISRDVLTKAKSGRYTQLEVNRGLPASLMVKYFKKQGLEWEIAPEVRSMIDFQEVNLLGGWPTMPPLDIVFIRNVLIYFNQETKKQILGRIRGLMRPDGYLFLGAAETTLNLDERLVRLPGDVSGCYQITPTTAAGRTLAA